MCTPLTSCTLYPRIRVIDNYLYGGIMINNAPRLSLGQPAQYQIEVHGILDSSWSDYFNGLIITQVQSTNQEPMTLLTGQVVDQLMLIGMLHRLCNLGLPIYSVKWLTNNTSSS